MSNVKDSLYNYFVRKNGRVWYEYERYVREHTEEHNSHRIKHLVVLLKLNYFYRIKKSNTPYMYWDVPLDPNVKQNSIEKVDNKNAKQTNAIKKLPLTSIEESQRQSAYAFAIGIKDYDVISFDAFDTLILRTVNLPEHLFMILGEEYGIYNFKKWRMQAEKEVRERNLLLNGNRECTLKEIYERLSYWTGIDAEKGMWLEFETELKMCVANPYMLQVYQILKSMKKRIYVTSNMYLPKDMLQKLLLNCGYSEFEDIIVSCDYSCSKTSGALFEMIKYREKDKRIVHIGDNLITDVEGAKKAGLETRYYKACREIGEKYRARGFSSLIGSAYYALINNKLHNGAILKSERNKFWELGYIHGGIATLGYVNWVHEKAKKEGKECVVFLARDGALLKKVYDDLYDDIPSVYLLWSRIAAIRNVNAGTREQILDRLFTENSNKGMSIESILMIMGWESLVQELNDAGICTKVPLVKENELIIKNWLTNNWDKIEVHQQKIESNMLEYISNVIGSYKKICLVDLGWTGKNASILKNVLVKAGYNAEDVNVCLLGSINKQQNPIKIYNDELSCYMFSFNYNREIHDEFCKMSTYALDLLEKMFSVTDCSFAGIDDEGKFLFAPPEMENYEAYNMITQGIMEFCDEYVSTYKDFPFMLQISGYDAWIALRQLLRNKKKVSDIMEGLVYVQGINILQKRASFSKLC